MLPPKRTSDTTILESVRANDLLAGVGNDASPAMVAGAVVQRFEELARYLVQLVGDLGVRALFARSVADTRTAYPWLTVPPTDSDPPWVALRGVLERQDPRMIRNAFVALLAEFLELFARLIGEGLVRRLLHDVWPEVFPQVAKETT